MKNLSLYVHIPFCLKKCHYCDFNSYSGYENMFNDYINSLINEIEENKKCFFEYKIKSIFIGGGTPSILPYKLIGKIIDTILNGFNVENDSEITIELNPKTVDFKKLIEYKSMHINRLSFGVQAVQNDILKYLGRVHKMEDFIYNMAQARDVGFNNINADIMFSLPNQNILQWEETLDKIIKLNLDHVSVYSLILEEGTPFYDMYNRGFLNKCDDELDRKMYYLAKEMLKCNGYNQYEISNFAKYGFECYHNKVYWKCMEYIGYGLGASSYFDGRRYNNTCDIEKYVLSKGGFDDIKENIELLSNSDMYAEYMFMGLRMNEGVSKKDFFDKFNVSIYDIYKNELKYLKDFNLIYENGDNITLTDKGIDISNTVFEKFIV